MMTIAIRYVWNEYFYFVWAINCQIDYKYSSVDFFMMWKLPIDMKTENESMCISMLLFSFVVCLTKFVYFFYTHNIFFAFKKNFENVKCYSTRGSGSWFSDVDDGFDDLMTWWGANGQPQKADNKNHSSLFKWIKNQINQTYPLHTKKSTFDSLTTISSHFDDILSLYIISFLCFIHATQNTKWTTASHNEWFLIHIMP